MATEGGLKQPNFEKTLHDETENSTHLQDQNSTCKNLQLIGEQQSCEIATNSDEGSIKSESQSMAELSDSSSLGIVNSYRGEILVEAPARVQIPLIEISNNVNSGVHGEKPVEEGIDMLESQIQQQKDQTDELVKEEERIKRYVPDEYEVATVSDNQHTEDKLVANEETPPTEIFESSGECRVSNSKEMGDEVNKEQKKSIAWLTEEHNSESIEHLTEDKDYDTGTAPLETDAEEIGRSKITDNEESVKKEYLEVGQKEGTILTEMDVPSIQSDLLNTRNDKETCSLVHDDMTKDVTEDSQRNLDKGEDLNDIIEETHKQNEFEEACKILEPFDDTKCEARTSSKNEPHDLTTAEVSAQETDQQAITLSREVKLNEVLNLEEPDNKNYYAPSIAQLAYEIDSSIKQTKVDELGETSLVQDKYGKITEKDELLPCKITTNMPEPLESQHESVVDYEGINGMEKIEGCCKDADRETTLIRWPNGGNQTENIDILLMAVDPEKENKQEYPSKSAKENIDQMNNEGTLDPEPGKEERDTVRDENMSTLVSEETEVKGKIITTMHEEGTMLNERSLSIEEASKDQDKMYKTDETAELMLEYQNTQRNIMQEKAENDILNKGIEAENNGDLPVLDKLTEETAQLRSEDMDLTVPGEINNIMLESDQIGIDGETSKNLSMETIVPWEDQINEAVAAMIPDEAHKEIEDLSIGNQLKQGMENSEESIPKECQGTELEENPENVLEKNECKDKIEILSNEIIEKIMIEEGASTKEEAPEACPPVQQKQEVLQDMGGTIFTPDRAVTTTSITEPRSNSEIADKEISSMADMNDNNETAMDEDRVKNKEEDTPAAHTLVLLEEYDAITKDPQDAPTVVHKAQGHQTSAIKNSTDVDMSKEQAESERLAISLEPASEDQNDKPEAVLSMGYAEPKGLEIDGAINITETANMKEAESIQENVADNPDAVKEKLVASNLSAKECTSLSTKNNTEGGPHKERKDSDKIELVQVLVLENQNQETIAEAEATPMDNIINYDDIKNTEAAKANNDVVWEIELDHATEKNEDIPKSDENGSDIPVLTKLIEETIQVRSEAHKNMELNKRDPESKNVEDIINSVTSEQHHEIIAKSDKELSHFDSSGESVRSDKEIGSLAYAETPLKVEKEKSATKVDAEKIINENTDDHKGCNNNSNACHVVVPENDSQVVLGNDEHKFEIFSSGIPEKTIITDEGPSTEEDTSKENPAVKHEEGFEKVGEKVLQLDDKAAARMSTNDQSSKLDLEDEKVFKISNVNDDTETTKMTEEDNMKEATRETHCAVSQELGDALSKEPENSNISDPEEQWKTITINDNIAIDVYKEHAEVEWLPIISKTIPEDQNGPEETTDNSTDENKPKAIDQVTEKSEIEEAINHHETANMKDDSCIQENVADIPDTVEANVASISIFGEWTSCNTKDNTEAEVHNVTKESAELKVMQEPVHENQNQVLIAKVEPTTIYRVTNDDTLNYMETENLKNDDVLKTEIHGSPKVQDLVMDSVVNTVNERHEEYQKYENGADLPVLSKLTNETTQRCDTHGEVAYSIFVSQDQIKQEPESENVEANGEQHHEIIADKELPLSNNSEECLNMDKKVSSLASTEGPSKDDTGKEANPEEVDESIYEKYNDHKDLNSDSDVSHEVVAGKDSEEITEVNKDMESTIFRDELANEKALQVSSNEDQKEDESLNKGNESKQEEAFEDVENDTSKENTAEQASDNVTETNKSEEKLQSSFYGDKLADETLAQVSSNKEQIIDEGLHKVTESKEEEAIRESVENEICQDNSAKQASDNVIEASKSEEKLESSSNNVPGEMMVEVDASTREVVWEKYSMEKQDKSFQEKDILGIPSEEELDRTNTENPSGNTDGENQQKHDDCNENERVPDSAEIEEIQEANETKDSSIDGGNKEKELQKVQPVTESISRKMSQEMDNETEPTKNSSSKDNNSIQDMKDGVQEHGKENPIFMIEEQVHPNTSAKDDIEVHVFKKDKDFERTDFILRSVPEDSIGKSEAITHDNSIDNDRLKNLEIVGVTDATETAKGNDEECLSKKTYDIPEAVGGKDESSLVEEQKNQVTRINYHMEDYFENQKTDSEKFEVISETVLKGQNQESVNGAFVEETEAIDAAKGPSMQHGVEGNEVSKDSTLASEAELQSLNLDKNEEARPIQEPFVETAANLGSKEPALAAKGDYEAEEFKDKYEAVSIIEEVKDTNFSSQGNLETVSGTEAIEMKPSIDQTLHNPNKDAFSTYKFSDEEERQKGVSPVVSEEYIFDATEETETIDMIATQNDNIDKQEAETNLILNEKRDEQEGKDEIEPEVRVSQESYTSECNMKSKEENEISGTGSQSKNGKMEIARMEIKMGDNARSEARKNGENLQPKDMENEKQTEEKNTDLETEVRERIDANECNKNQNLEEKESIKEVSRKQQLEDVNPKNPLDVVLDGLENTDGGINTFNEEKEQIVNNLEESSQKNKTTELVEERVETELANCSDEQIHASDSIEGLLPQQNNSEVAGINQTKEDQKNMVDDLSSKPKFTKASTTLLEIENFELGALQKNEECSQYANLGPVREQEENNKSEGNLLEDKKVNAAELDDKVEDNLKTGKDVAEHSKAESTNVTDAKAKEQILENENEVRNEEPDIKVAAEITDAIQKEIQNDTIEKIHLVPSNANTICLSHKIGTSSTMDDDQKNLHLSNVTTESSGQTMKEVGENLDKISELLHREWTEDDPGKKSLHVEAESEDMIGGDALTSDVNDKGNEVLEETTNSQLMSVYSGNIDGEGQVKLAEPSNLLSCECDEENEYHSIKLIQNEEKVQQLCTEQAKEAGTPEEVNDRVQQMKEASFEVPDIGSTKIEEAELTDQDDLPVSRYLMDRILQEEGKNLDKSCNQESEERKQEDYFTDEMHNSSITKQESNLTTLTTDPVTQNSSISDGKITSHLVLKEDLDVDENTENEMAENCPRSEGNMHDKSSTLAVGEGVKEEVSCLLSESLNHIVSSNSMEFAQAQSSDSESKVDADSSIKPDEMQHDKTCLSVSEEITGSTNQEDDESMKKAVEISPTYIASEQTILPKEDSKEGMLDIENIKQPSDILMKQSSSLSEPVADEKVLDLTEECVLTLGEALSIQSKPIEVKKREDNQDGITELQMQNMKGGFKEEPKASDSDKTHQIDASVQSANEMIQLDERFLEEKYAPSTVDKPTYEEKDVHMEEEKIDEEKDEKRDQDEHENEEDRHHSAVTEEARDADLKPVHKKSHNILSGVGSKVKHSIAKVKKAITGKPSHSKAVSPK